MMFVLADGTMHGAHLADAGRHLQEGPPPRPLISMSSPSPAMAFSLLWYDVAKGPWVRIDWKHGRRVSRRPTKMFHQHFNTSRDPGAAISRSRFGGFALSVHRVGSGTCFKGMDVTVKDGGLPDRVRGPEIRAIHRMYLEEAGQSTASRRAMGKFIDEERLHQKRRP